MTITVTTHKYPAGDASQPALAVQITRLTGSMMIWVGEDASGGNEDATTQGRLARDWAVGMPSGGTSLFRSSGSDCALSMACRLAHRLQQQVFLSVDVAERSVMWAEKRIVSSL
ncbi:hypothetical protein C8J57DRAFT_1285057 [Mycena rebaudengoi]|nr:hypothetical protein C8J57DRAFT_1285057 [Mycena rebaudengoi]